MTRVWQRRLSPSAAGHFRVPEHSANRRRGASGFALVGVVWAIALLCVMAMDVLAAAQREAATAADLRERARLAAAADAGLTLGIHGLLRGGEAGRSLTFDGVRLSIAIEHEAGKLDLNLASARQLRGLFEALELPPAAAEAASAAIQDWRDADEAPRPRGGAETQEYRAVRSPVPPRDSPFQTVDELAHVLNVGPWLAARAAPAFTVHSKRESIDRGRAGPLALAAMGGVRGGPLEASAEDPLFPPRPGVDPRAGRVFTVRVTAATADGQLERSAVVRLTGGGRETYWIQQYR